MNISYRSVELVKKREKGLKKYIYVVYIVLSVFLPKNGLYPWGILWECLGYHLA